MFTGSRGAGRTRHQHQGQKYNYKYDGGRSYYSAAAGGYRQRYEAAYDKFPYAIAGLTTGLKAGVSDLIAQTYDMAEAIYSPSPSYERGVDANLAATLVQDAFLNRDFCVATCAGREH